MRRLAAGLVFVMVCPSFLLAQERDRSLERISIALGEQPAPFSMGVPLPAITPRSQTFGIFTFVSPTLSGEFVRVSVPIGELISQRPRGWLPPTGDARRRLPAGRYKPH